MISHTTEPILLAGDWHGNILQAYKVLDHAADNGVEVIIQLGDFGIWHDDKRYLNKMQARLEQHGQTLYFVDGNHEAFKRLYEKPILEDGTRRVRERIFHLPRGHRFTLNGHSFLALGGAASIDRKFRRVDRSWWAEELLTEDDVQKSIEGGYADIMLCHDSPSSAPNSVTDNALGQMRAQLAFGPEALNTCNNHRQTLDRVFREVKPRMLFHGHYHEFMTGTVDWDTHSTSVIGLDEGAASLPKHTYMLGHRREPVD